MLIRRSLLLSNDLSDELNNVKGLKEKNLKEIGNRSPFSRENYALVSMLLAQKLHYISRAYAEVSGIGRFAGTRGTSDASDEF